MSKPSSTVCLKGPISTSLINSFCKLTNNCFYAKQLKKGDTYKEMKLHGIHSHVIFVYI